MEMNYTPLDIASFQKNTGAIQPSHKSFSFNAILLILIVVTLAILAVLLYLLIQKKLQELAYTPFFA